MNIAGAKAASVPQGDDMNASTRNIVQRRWLNDVDLDRRDRWDRPTLPTDVIAAMEDAAGAGGDRRDNGR